MNVQINRAPETGRTVWRVKSIEELSADAETAAWLDPSRIHTTVPLPELSAQERDALQAGSLTAVNTAHPRWQEALTFVDPKPGKKRVHLLAVGDVGGTFLIALKLLGGDVIDKIGIRDLNQNAVTRWAEELGQISWPWDYDCLPEVEAIAEDQLFDCDVFVFAAAKAVPALDSGIQDVRMAQLAANRPLVEHFARMAREKAFKGLFVVMSDPVDPLCQAAYRAANSNSSGQWDGMGLLAEQIQGFGSGVMNARAAWFAKQDARFQSFLQEGRTFGPHGQGLVVVNSLTHYDDALSRELTDLTLSANHRIRDLGYKPYVAPAVSSGAMQLLLTLRGAWHCGSVCLGGIWFGVRNRYTRFGLEIETVPLPELVFQRLRETETLLHAIGDDK